TATEVNIVATDELLERGEVTLSTVITERQITELPLSEGAAYNLATQAPGVSYTGNPMFSGPTANGNLAAIRTNGASGNQITLDGSPNLGLDGGVAYTPPADALSQFKIQTSPFDAQTGFTAGSTVNVAVKSGTNKLHGSAYYFNRPETLTANNFFSNRAGIERPERSYYRAGGQVNGPVYIPYLYNGKDKTFFMFSYEKQVDTAAEPETFTVPTALMRTGNFSELLSITNAQGVLTPVLIFDPATAALRNTTCTAGSTGTTVCRTPFTGNIIPENRLNAAARAFLNLYPLPNQPGIQNGTVDNYFSNQLRRRPYDSYLTRIDHNFNGNHRIYAKVFYSKSNEDRYNFIGEPDSITQGFETRTNKGGNVNYTATLSSNFVLDVRSSLNQFGQKTEPANPMSAADLGFTGIAPFTSSTVFPRFLFTNYDTLGAERAQFNEGLNRNFKLFSLQPTLTQIFGDHTLKYGYDYRRLMENRITNLYNAGSFSFTGAYTSQASNSTNQADIGRDLAAFLLGIPTSSTIEQGVPYDVYSNYHGFFVQDDWRVSPKLTLNLGLRYDLETGVREAEGRIVTGFDTTSASPLRAGALANFNASVPAGVPITAFQNLSGGLRFASGSNDANQATDKNNFQPRIGVSYALNDKTVIRGGFGIFTSAFQIQPIDQSGFTGATSFTTNSNDNGRTFLTTLNNPFPNGLNPIVGSSLGLNTLVGNIIGTTNATGPTETTIYSYDRKNANYARFIFGVQRQLPFDIGVEATFVYSRGSNLPVLRQLNYIPREYLNNLEGVTDGATILNAIAATASSFNTVPNPFRGLVPQNAALNGQTINRRLLLTQFPQFNDLIVTEYNGSNTYRSLQLQANKRLSSGFSFNASYTLARDKEKTRRLNPQDEELNETLSNFDRPHRITFSGVFELPFGRNRKFFSDVHPVVDAVFGGWQFNAIYEWQSGEPLVLQNVFYNGDITQLENLLGKSDSEGRRYGIDIPAFDVSGFRVLDNRPTLPNGNVNPAFNTLVTPAFGNNYTVGSQNTLRYLPYTLDNFRNQPFQKFDVGLTKNFQIREGMRLQVRVEAINALNTPYFGAGLQLAANNAAFGRVTGQRNLPRDIQLGARFTF
ncbi:MAG TPA: TonB-dependent receptor, partial [Pyrinomonadaceae bacterium]